MSNTPFPDPAPNTHSVSFKMPLPATAAELKAWFDTKIKHKWRIACGGKGVAMSVVEPRSYREWRLRIGGWDRIASAAEPFDDGTYYSIVANFDDPKDAMLFKLTWG